MEADPSTHSVVIAPHLWRALLLMARDTSVEPGSLVNQAIFAWLRSNGYVSPGTSGQPGKSPLGPSASVPTPMPSRRSSSSLVPPPLPSAPPKPPVDPAVAALEGVVARMAEIDADLARLTRPPAPSSTAGGTGNTGSTGAGTEATATGGSAESAGSGGSAGLSPGVGTEPPDGTPGPPKGASEGAVAPVSSTALVAFVQREGEAPVRITRDRFVIGRGSHCDLIIDSPRVSREHSALFKMGAGWVLEDLGSANGTWVGDERVVHHELKSGDVVQVGDDRIVFSLRAEG